MKEQIKNIIESYCEGINHLEFNIADLDKMADEILDLQLQQTGVSGSIEIINECKRCQFDSNLGFCPKCDTQAYCH